MGNKISMPTSNIFQNDLVTLNNIVNNILTEDNQFKNPNYSFLYEDVCKSHTILLEEELSKHLKVSLKSLGTNLYLLPQSDDVTTSQGTKISKKDICKKISSHYMRILYMLTLVKYVYDLEHHGDLSIAGILFRNIKIEDGLMSISFCSMPQKDYTQTTQDYKVDFGTLEGMTFFIDYVLEKGEAKGFIEVLRAILSRTSKSVIRRNICNLVSKNGLSKQSLKEIESIYTSKFKSSLHCELSPINNKAEKVSSIRKKPNLYMKIEKDNPVFQKEYCYNVNQFIIRLDSKNKEVIDAFKTMQNNYKKNVKSIESLIDKLVMKTKEGKYELHDITKLDLDKVVADIKTTIKVFYLQSIVDYQNLLDVAKKNQIIEVNKEK
jgi:hypothetical protein